MIEDLRQLSDEELQLIVKQVDVNLFLDPIKKHNRLYVPYIKQFGGRLDKRNPLVVTYMPKVATKIYRSGDKSYETIFQSAARALGQNLEDIVETVTGEEWDDEKFQNVSPEELTGVLNDAKEKDVANKVNLDLLWLQYKLKGIDYSEEKRNRVKELYLDEGMAKPVGAAESDDFTDKQEEATTSETMPSGAASESGEEKPDDERTAAAEATIETAIEAAVETGVEAIEENILEKSGTEESNTEESNTDESNTEESNTEENQGNTDKKETEEKESLKKKDTKTKKESAKEKAERLYQQRMALQKARQEQEKKERLAREEEERKQKEKEAAEKEALRNEAAKHQGAATGYPSTYGDLFGSRKKYIGRINIINNHYNFTPLYEQMPDGTWSALREDEIDNLLEGSERQNIEFAYSGYDQHEKDFMESRFRDRQLVIFEFEIEELEANLDSYGSAKQTAYMIHTLDMFKNHRILFLSDEKLYAVHSEDDLLDNLGTRKIVRVDYENIVEGEKILIDDGNGFYAGPYTVKYAPASSSYCIVTDILDNNSIASGYAETQCKHIRFWDSNYTWSTNEAWDYYYADESCDVVMKDMINPKDLLRSFSASIDHRRLSELEDVAADVENYMSSNVIGENIPDDIRSRRYEKLLELVESITDVDVLSEDALDIIYNLIINNKDDVRVTELVDSIIDKHPELIDGIPGIRRVEERIDKGQKKLQEIEEDISDAQEKQRAIEAPINKQLEEKARELDETCRKLKVANNIAALHERREDAENILGSYEKRISSIRESSSHIEEQFDNILNNYSSRMADIAFDGFLSAKMLQAAAEWEKKDKAAGFDAATRSVNEIKNDFETADELVDYLVNTIQIARPQYDRNLIINIIICISQGFLTVFSGNPGCGKTSICNIVAKVMGLTKLNDMLIEPCEGLNMNRYIPVSVERGWTSKRDFIGYYNPLTKTFEENNREVLNGLKVLDYEWRNGLLTYPFYILLDEANLSSMEYYWADFMSACDDPETKHTINLGNENIFTIPETLHFMATINNDNTTEELSPRLIDRAWTVTLPKSTTMYGDTIPEADIRIVPWDMLRKIFAGDFAPVSTMELEIMGVYADIRKHLRKEEYEISPRVDAAIKLYCRIAAKLMDDNEELGISADIIALDYAVSQKILPKIEGSGDEYREWLKGLSEICAGNNLLLSRTIIDNIIRCGDKKNMGFYRFF